MGRQNDEMAIGVSTKCAREEKMSSFPEKVYRVVAQVPEGCVISYGQIARLLGSPHAARQVGWAMSRCPQELPWQRVVKADGSVAGGMFPELCKAMLRAEKVPFLEDGRVDMGKCQWNGLGT